jgi:hypothetical protein
MYVFSEQEVGYIVSDFLQMQATVFRQCYQLFTHSFNSQVNYAAASLCDSFGTINRSACVMEITLLPQQPECIL